VGTGHLKGNRNAKTGRSALGRQRVISKKIKGKKVNHADGYLIRRVKRSGQFCLNLGH